MAQHQALAPQELEPSPALTYQTMLLSASIVLDTIRELGYKGALFGDVAAKLHKAFYYEYPRPTTVKSPFRSIVLQANMLMYLYLNSNSNALQHVQILLLPASSHDTIPEPIYTILEKIASSHPHLTLAPNFQRSTTLLHFENIPTRTFCHILVVLPGTLGLPTANDLKGGDLEWIMARVGHDDRSQSQSQSQSQSSFLTTLPTVPLVVLLVSALERWQDHKTTSKARSVDMLLEACGRRRTAVTRRNGQKQRMYELGWGVERRWRIAAIVREFCQEGK